MTLALRMLYTEIHRLNLRIAAAKESYGTAAATEFNRDFEKDNIKNFQKQLESIYKQNVVDNAEAISVLRELNAARDFFCIRRIHQLGPSPVLDAQVVHPVVAVAQELNWDSSQEIGAAPAPEIGSPNRHDPRKICYTPPMRTDREPGCAIARSKEELDQLMRSAVAKFWPCIVNRLDLGSTTGDNGNPQPTLAVRLLIDAVSGNVQNQVSPVGDPNQCYQFFGADNYMSFLHQIAYSSGGMISVEIRHGDEDAPSAWLLIDRRNMGDPRYFRSYLWESDHGRIKFSIISDVLLKTYFYNNPLAKLRLSTIEGFDWRSLSAPKIRYKPRTKENNPVLRSSKPQTPAIYSVERDFTKLTPRQIERVARLILGELWSNVARVSRSGNSVNSVENLAYRRREDGLTHGERLLLRSIDRVDPLLPLTPMQGRPGIEGPFDSAEYCLQLIDQVSLLQAGMCAVAFRASQVFFGFVLIDARIIDSKGESWRYYLVGKFGVRRMGISVKTRTGLIDKINNLLKKCPDLTISFLTTTGRLWKRIRKRAS